MPEESPRKWKVKSRQRVFRGGPIREVAVEHVVLPNGVEIPDYYQIVLPDYVLIFATTERDEVMLFRQYKHGIGRVCLGLPGGTIDGDESPLDAAQRELFEETGYASDLWRGLGAYVTNANQRCNTAHLFVAERCRKIGPPTVPDLEQPDLLLVSRAALWSTVTPQEVGQAAHLALLTLATHPAAMMAGPDGPASP